MSILFLRSSASVGGGGGAPAWLTAMTYGVWDNAFTSAEVEDVLDPLALSTNFGSTGGMVRGYCGMGSDRTNRRLFLLKSGGHGDHFGNEVYVLDLDDAVPAWRRLRNADAKEGDGVSSYAKWPGTGRPSSDHTGALTFEGEGRWLSLGMGGTNYQGNPAQGQWWEFDHAGTNDYIDLGGSHASNTAGTTSCAGVYVPAISRAVVIHSGNGNPSLEYVRLSDMAVTASNTNGLPTGGGIMHSLDTTNNILLIKNDATTYDYYAINVGTENVGAFTNITASGDTPPQSTCFDWHDASDAHMAWNKSSGLFMLKPSGISGGMYTGLVGSTVSTSNDPTLDNVNAAPNLYNRCSILDMGGGERVMFLLQWTGTSALRLDPAGY